jgi:transcriptional regulator with XRE-family HTH domain
MSRKLNVSPQEQARWKEIGAIIRRVRETQRPPMSMAKLGQAIRKSKGLIGQIERGEVNPLIHIVEIASALGRFTAYFLPPSASSSRVRKLPKRLDQTTSEQQLLEDSYRRVCDAFIKPNGGGYPDIVRCWTCGRKPGSCRCHRQCPKCGRIHPRGQDCSNPEHYRISNL